MKIKKLILFDFVLFVGCVGVTASIVEDRSSLILKNSVFSDCFSPCYVVISDFDHKLITENMEMYDVDEWVTTTSTTNGKTFSISYLPLFQKLKIDLFILTGKKFEALWHHPRDGKCIVMNI